MTKPASIARMNAAKRFVDVALVILLAPALILAGLLTSAVVALTIGRPVVFRQTRVGLDEREFQLLKFRTMTDARDRMGRLLPDRDRMTRVGSLLRQFSLDELPQFLNILRGDMALIGPRPLYPEYLSFYRGRERKRHWVRPGITGLAQISGRNGLHWNARLSLDADYVEQLNPRLDLSIFARTIVKVLRSSDVSAVPNDSGERLDHLRSYPTCNGYSLRRFESRDIPIRVRLFHDPRIRLHMSLPEGITAESTAEWLRRAWNTAGRRDFVAYGLETETVVALLGVRDRAEHPGIPEMYILVDPAQQGKGIGALSLELLLAWMRNQHVYRGCWLSVSERNIAATRLYRKFGFVTTGVDALDPSRLEMTLRWD